jgi:tetratricopeptide (TPR) repeat protein
MRRLLVVAALLVSPVVHAGDKISPEVQAKADVMFDKAQGFYEAGQYQAAIPLFQEAYELVHDPVYLFNIAQSYRRVLDCVSAFDYYNRYLTAATDADARQREKVKGWLRELQPCVEERQRDLEAVKLAEEAEQRRRAEELTKRRAAQVPRYVEVDRGRPFRIGGLVTTGAGAAVLVVGILYAARGSSLKTELADDCSDANGCDWSDPTLRQKDADGTSANTRARIGLIGGGVMALVGTGLYIYGRTKIETVQVSPSEGGATISARVSF